MYVPLDAFLLRAPLLPVAMWRRGAAALRGHPLGGRAIELASPGLARAKPGAARERALERYGRRAAFRATPHGLLAGVCVGALGPRTRVATGTPAAVTRASFEDIDRVARALLDDADLRPRTALRLAPSAAIGAAAVRWIGPGEPFGETREAELDGTLAAIVEAARSWTPWPAVRARVAAAQEVQTDDDEADELLLALVDSGLLQSDLAPPLVGPPPGQHLAARLDALGVPDADDVVRSAGERAAVLVHRPREPPALARAAVARAARLVPLLAGLQEALAPPAAERLAQPALADALDALTEGLGAGAFDLDALATGDYGVDPGDPDDDAPDRAPAAGVLAVVLDAVVAAAARRASEAPLDPAAVGAALAAAGLAPAPPTAELFLAPTPPRPGARPGAGWLVGLHAPAGASLGRFAHALGAPLIAALEALAAAERRARPDEERLDVAFAPSPTLADLAAHPKLRARTLALSRWNDADDLAPRDLATRDLDLAPRDLDLAPRDLDLAPRDLDLVADPAAPEALALRARGGAPVVPSPLARVRSATAPAGVPRLLVGWSLQRQHAPWALPLGPLAGLAFVPRITLDGFVIHPASWRLPASLDRAALARWRRERRVPRVVQVGDGDELLAVDLADPGAAADLAGQTRVFEIWPPLDEVVDRDGRRVEAVVMLVDEPDATTAAAAARAAAAVRRAGDVPPPHRAPPVAGWRSFKLFGAAAHQDAVLATAVAPAVEAGRAAGEIDRWFFLRYVDGPGRRPHLRLRVHGPGVVTRAFERRLDDALAPARARAAVTAVEADDYQPERGRFAADELDVVLALLESDSALVSGLLADDTLHDDLGRIALAVRGADALARGLGLDLAARHAVAKERRGAADAAAALDDEARRAADVAFRIAGRGLRAALAGEPSGPFADHAARVATAAVALPRARRESLLPTLLHLAAVRLLGPDRDAERLALTFWQRVLEGLRRA
jgi:thiopeptide-type bacteriocin biosynthesis protein